ncbi:MAG: shikimate kinase, partial [Oscillospiraceae bacterium]
MNNIYLCGFMGCGKTTIAKKLATLLNQNFVDTDELIIKNCNNMSITEIFSSFSEGYFRSLETQVLTRLALTKNTVVSL